MINDKSEKEEHTFPSINISGKCFISRVIMMHELAMLDVWQTWRRGVFEKRKLRSRVVEADVEYLRSKKDIRTRYMSCNDRFRRNTYVGPDWLVNMTVLKEYGVEVASSCG